MPSSQVKVSQPSEVHINPSSRSKCKLSQARNHHKEGRACCLLHAGLMPGLLFSFEDGRYIPLKCQLTFTGLHGAIS